MIFVRSPEQIQAQVKRDLHILVSLERQGAFSPGVVMVQEWISNNLPNAKTELVSPPEGRGYLAGNRGASLWLDFSSEDLMIFASHWERNGKSIDERFQRYVFSYSNPPDLPS